jgi:hypothetical protein
MPSEAGTPEPGSEAPIACSLTVGDLAEREGAIDRLFARSSGRERTERGVRIHFSTDATLERELAELVGAERECCPFLDFDLREDGGHLTLTVEGPPEARQTVDMFASAARA